ncbi:MAG TPA: response regulator [Thermoguttaceae bacterium]|nr:response regulator [Thermoguttaceae bacterium]
MTTILFADDNPNIREYCRRELEEEGYRVVVVGNGAEALRLTRYLEPDLLVLDVCMPVLDGLEAVDRIKSLRPELPVILFTSFDDLCVRNNRSCCATACVEKREDLSELKQVIAAALTAHRLKRPYRLGLPPVASPPTPVSERVRRCVQT